MPSRAIWGAALGNEGGVPLVWGSKQGWRRGAGGALQGAMMALGALEPEEEKS